MKEKKEEGMVRWRSGREVWERWRMGRDELKK